LRELRAPAWKGDLESLAFATRRGFRKDSLIIVSRLDVTAFDTDRGDVVETAGAAGIRFFSLAEVVETSEHRPSTGVGGTTCTERPGWTRRTGPAGSSVYPLRTPCCPAVPPGTAEVVRSGT
jgi:hypothetical protein